LPRGPDVFAVYRSTGRKYIRREPLCLPVNSAAVVTQLEVANASENLVSRSLDALSGNDPIAARPEFSGDILGLSGRSCAFG
jgi:hypothetical protein